MPWLCPKCKERIEDQFDSCWKCAGAAQVPSPTRDLTWTIIPHGKENWLRFVVFPFKAYVVIGPILFLILSQIIPRPHHSSPPEALALLLVLLFPCALILLFAALLFALFGPKGHALDCVIFAVLAFFAAAMILPSLATA
jgi:hypothetical protein